MQPPTPATLGNQVTGSGHGGTCIVSDELCALPPRLRCGQGKLHGTRSLDPTQTQHHHSFSTKYAMSMTDSCPVKSSHRERSIHPKCQLHRPPGSRCISKSGESSNSLQYNEPVSHRRRQPSQAMVQTPSSLNRTNKGTRIVALSPSILPGVSTLALCMMAPRMPADGLGGKISSRRGHEMSVSHLYRGGYQKPLLQKFAFR